MDKAREWYQRLVQDFPESQAKPRGLGALRRLTMVGKPLNFTAQTISGDKIDLAQLRGQVVVVHFWASWSETSVAEIQQLKTAYSEYRAKGFEVVGISLDQAVESVTAFVRRSGLAWPQVFEPGGLDSKYAVDFGIIYPPTMFLIGPDGRVVNRNASVVDVRNLLAETFDKSKPAGKDDEKVADRPKAGGKN
jgi:peroxiredoxin